MELKRYKTSVALLAVASNSTLTALKLVVGIMIGSVSVISEGIHSGVDLVSSLIAFLSVRKASQPPDDSHPFGHGKLENVSGTIEALLIFFAAGWIIAEAIHKLRYPGDVSSVGWGVILMFFSALINLAVSQAELVVAKAAESLALEADAWHLRTDVYTSAGVLTGLLIIWIGQRLWPGVNLRWVDPVAAILVALLIIRTSYQLVIKSARDIFDYALPADEVARIREAILRQAPDLISFHGMRTRKAGPNRYVEVHIVLDRNMSLEDSHRLSRRVRDEISSLFTDIHVAIHVDPCDETCLPDCVENCPRPDKGVRDPRGDRAHS
jgi:cation diffusion facilitator family transporter